MTRIISVSNGRARALIDDIDYRAVIGVGPWYLRRTSDGHQYVQRRVYLPDAAPFNESLHTFLTGWPLVDHINGDGLDNRRENLRPATPGQNCANARLRRDNSSGFKGVRYQRTAWIARIQCDRKPRYLGRFPTAVAAARAYDAAARDLFGEFARLNFPDEE